MRVNQCIGGPYLGFQLLSRLRRQEDDWSPEDPGQSWRGKKELLRENLKVLIECRPEKTGMITSLPFLSSTLPGSIIEPF